MPKNEILPGTLVLLVLRVLQPGALHGYAIAQRIHALSHQALQVEEGSLYPALHRLEHRGFIKAEWGPSEANRKAKYYSLTPAGKKSLKIQTSAWQEMQRAIGSIMSYRPLKT